MTVTNVTCSSVPGNSNTGFKCKKPDGNVECIPWRYFYPNCPVNNLQCVPTDGAFCPAITICGQSLFA